MTTLTALRGLTLDPGGNDCFEKDADTLQAPASMTKMITGITARKWITDLSATITVAAGDLVGGSSANLQAGDVLTYQDAFYGMMLPSGNDAATAIGRTVGGLIAAAQGGTGGVARFVTEMNATAARLGLTGMVFYDPPGLSANGRGSARLFCHLIRYIDATDPWFRGVMGTSTHTMTITGANARTYAVTGTDYSSLPRWVAGKTGSIVGSGSCVTILWDADDGGRYASSILNSTQEARMVDLQAMIDEAVARGNRPATCLRTRGISGCVSGIRSAQATPARWRVA